MRRVRVATDRWNFELEGTGEPIVPIGGNMLNDEHPFQRTLFSHFDAADCDRRFGLMSECGLNCLRQAIGVNEVFDPATGLKAEGMRNWDTFIRLAEKHGVYLMPVGGYIGGNDWFDVDRLDDNGRPLDESCAFWSAFAGHFAGHPAIWAWDLCNELLYDNKPAVFGYRTKTQEELTALLCDGWPAWLQTRYESVDTMNRAYGASYRSFHEVPTHVRFCEKPFDPCLSDFRHYLNERGYHWCKRQCDVIRRVAPGHMIVSGNNTWLSPDQDLWLANGFHNRAIHDLFDFVTHHPYPACQAVPDGRGDPLDNPVSMRYWLNACIGMSRLDYYGKPMMIQEFGWYGGGTSRFKCELPHRSEEEHAAYMDRLIEALSPHAVGFINWPLMDMPAASDISNHGGIFTADGRPKALAQVYRRLAEQVQGKRQVRAEGATTLTFSLTGLFTSRVYQDRMWDAVHMTLEAGQIPDFRFI